MLNKSKIQHNFNKSAQNYDNFAQLQVIVAKNLVNFAKKYLKNGQNILDLGSGTGFVAKNIDSLGCYGQNIVELDLAYEMLKKSQNSSRNLKINADIEDLPLKNHHFDLIFSSLALQWVNNLPKTVKNIQNLLKNDVKLAFSIIINGSLVELKQSALKTGVNLSLNSFINEQDLQQIFQNNVKIEEICLKYDDIYDLLASIKKIGAGYSHKTGQSHLKKSDFEKINDFYLKNFNIKGKIIATWRIAYILT